MTFREDATDQFLQIFNQSKERIRAFPGCQRLQLLQDHDDPNVFSTYSVWNSEAELNNYRKSELFGGVWPETKALFAEKPVASSYLLREEIK